MYNFYPKKLVQPPGYAAKILLIMKLTAILIVATILQVSASTFAQKITLSEKNTPLNKVFKKISDQSGYDFIISSESLKQSNSVTIKVQDEELRSTLNRIFDSQPLRFVIQEKMVVVSRKIEFQVQQEPIYQRTTFKLEGTVTDADGTILAGATVRIKGTSQAVITGKEGFFEFSDMPDEATLIVSFIGYQATEIAVNKAMIQPVIIRLKPEINPLNQVQVIGYGTTTKRYNTGNVSTVKAVDIENQPVTNVLSALSGRAPGVLVQTTNGLPGGGINIQIRGKGSVFAGTDPLYIVDGIPYASSFNTAGNVFATSAINGAVSPLNSLNPEDIESINILKDADATSIYGSRGSNGVVLITTKKGKTGRTTIDLNLNTGVSQIASLPRLLNADQYRQIRTEANNNDGLTPGSDPNGSNYTPDLTVWNTTKPTDWRKYLLGQTGRQTNFNGSIAGGNQNTSFIVGGTYRAEKTILPGDNSYNRAGLHVNLQHNSVDNKFSFQFSSTYNSDKNKLSNQTSNFAGDLMLPPNFPLYDKTGNYNYYLGWNPLADQRARLKTGTENTIINGIARYTLFRGFQVKLSGGYNKTSIDQLFTYPSNSEYQGSGNFSYFGRTSNSSIIAEPQLEYRKSLKRSSLTILAGGTYQNSHRDNSFTRAANFSSDLLLENIGSASTYTATNGNINYKYLSLFGRASFDYDQKYLLNASIRRDGSSRFGPGNQFGTFGALGAAYLFSNEDWVKEHLSFVSYGKIRGSYGITGNDQISDYQYLSAYSSSGYVYQDTSGVQPSRISNANFHWETTRKLEYAIELGFAKDRVLINVSRYQNRTKDQLVNYSVPFISGFSSYQANLPAVVENSGWEFELNTKNISGNTFKWSTNFNLTLPKNKLLSFENLTTSSYSKTLVIGQPITRLYGYQFTGLDDGGRPLFQTQTGIPSNLPSAATDGFYTIGKGSPEFYGGIGNTFNLKNWQLDIFGQFVKQFSTGGLVYTPGLLTNNFSYILGRWQKPGDRTIIPKASTSLDYYTQYSSSSANIFNSSYFRLKNIALSYTLSDSWLKRYKIQRLRIYFQGENVLTFWQKNNPFYDPETGASTNIPPLRSLIAGIQVTL